MIGSLAIDPSIGFQPTRPRGARPIPAGTTTQSVVFQPTRPRGARLRQTNSLRDNRKLDGFREPAMRGQTPPPHPAAIREKSASNQQLDAEANLPSFFLQLGVRGIRK